MDDLVTSLARTGRDSSEDFDIKILAADWQAEGITKNQAFLDYAIEGETLADALTTLLMKINPLPAVKNARDPNQKLVWVIGPDPDDAKKRIVLFTTRAASAKRGDKPPEAFQLQP